MVRIQKAEKMSPLFILVHPNRSVNAFISNGSLKIIFFHDGLCCKRYLYILKSFNLKKKLTILEGSI